MTKKQPTPWDIMVDLHEIGDDDHREICIGASLAGPEDHSFTRAEVLAGARWIAGIIARSALVLRDDLDQTASQCGCTPGWPDACAVGFDEMIVDPASDPSERPEIWFVIPTAQRAAWLAKVKKTLQQIIAADQWQPTAADERTWQNRQTNASQHVMAPIPSLDSSQETR